LRGVTLPDQAGNADHISPDIAAQSNLPSVLDWCSYAMLHKRKALKKLFYRPAWLLAQRVNRV